MRLFLAIELGSSLLDALDVAIAPLREEVAEIAWVPREKRHLTLKFLGDVEDGGASRITAAVERVAAGHRPFELTLREVGAFPNFRRARVVWIGVEHDPRLELLQHDLEVACEEAGFEVEGRPFRPHVTVARVRVPWQVERARQVARLARSVRWSAAEMVQGVTLMESMLAPAGARYVRLHAATLRGR
jgi:2'-5' RNA ligase